VESSFIFNDQYCGLVLKRNSQEYDGLWLGSRKQNFISHIRIPEDFHRLYIPSKGTIFMNLKGFLKPTIGKIALSVLILVSWDLYMASLPPQPTYLPVQPVSFITWLSGQIVMFVVLYLVSCVVAAVYSKLKKK
jgi:hypothetical protein